MQEAEGEPMDQGATAPSTSSTVASGSSSSKDTPLTAGGVVGLGMKRTGSDGTTDSKQRQRVQAQVSDPHWALEKQHVDSIINFLIRYVDFLMR